MLTDFGMLCMKAEAVLFMHKRSLYNYMLGECMNQPLKRPLRERAHHVFGF